MAPVRSPVTERHCEAPITGDRTDSADRQLTEFVRLLARQAARESVSGAAPTDASTTDGTTLNTTKLRKRDL